VSPRLDRARVCEENVDFAFLPAILLIEVIEILQLDTSQFTATTFLPISSRLYPTPLSPPRNEKERSLRNETLGSGEPDSLLPPVITATLPCNACIVLLLRISHRFRTRFSFLSYVRFFSAFPEKRTIHVADTP